MQTFQINSHINENGILSVKLPKELAEKDVNVYNRTLFARYHDLYLHQKFQSEQNESDHFPLQRRIETIISLYSS